MNAIRTMEDLIELVMDRVRLRFYHDKPAREWARDRNALMKAVMRYGHECHRRGWRFDVESLAVRLLELLNRIERPTGAGWFPIYLEQAVDQHVREHAEEIQAAARAIESKLAAVLGRLPAASAVRPPDAAEMAGAVFTELKRRQREAAERKRLDRELPPVEPDLFGAGAQRRREGAKGERR